MLEIITNPVTIGVIIMLALCVIKVNVIISLLVSAFVIGFLGHMAPDVIMSSIITGLNGNGTKEVVVSWQMNTGAYLLGAYSLEEVMNRNVQQAAVSSSASGAAAVPKQDALRAEEWMTTAYTEYALYDLDQDTRTEIAVIQVDPAGTNSTVQLYGWRDGTFMIRDTVSLSAGIVSNSGGRRMCRCGPCISPANWPTGATRWMW